jgi:hypothetical protein
MARELGAEKRVPEDQARTGKNTESIPKEFWEPHLRSGEKKPPGPEGTPICAQLELHARRITDRIIAG